MEVHQELLLQMAGMPIGNIDKTLSVMKKQFLSFLIPSIIAGDLLYPAKKDPSCERLQRK
jgi:hypothetical protein